MQFRFWQCDCLIALLSLFFLSSLRRFAKPIGRANVYCETSLPRATLSGQLPQLPRSPAEPKCGWKNTGEGGVT